MKKILLLAVFCLISVNAYPFWVWSPKTQTWKNPKNSPLATPSLQMAKADRYFSDGKYQAAAKEYKKILVNYPDAKEAADAQYFLGRCLEETNKQYDAFIEYQKVIDTYPNSQKISEVVERQFKIGEYFLNKDYKKILGLGKYDFMEHPSVEIFTKIVDKSSFSPFAAHAQYNLGLVYSGLGRFEEARDAFQKLLDTYPESEWSTPAKYQLAIATAKASPGVDYDSTAVKEATVRLDEFIKDHPQATIASAAAVQLDDLKEKEARKNFDIAAFYEKQGQYKAAQSYYKLVVERYNATTLYDLSSQGLSRMNDLLGKDINSKADLIKKNQQEIKEKKQQEKQQLKAQKITNKQNAIEAKQQLKAQKIANRKKAIEEKQQLKAQKITNKQNAIEAKQQLKAQKIANRQKAIEEKQQAKLKKQADQQAKIEAKAQAKLLKQAKPIENKISPDLKSVKQQARQQKIQEKQLKKQLKKQQVQEAKAKKLALKKAKQQADLEKKQQKKLARQQIKEQKLAKKQQLIQEKRLKLAAMPSDKSARQAAKLEKIKFKAQEKERILQERKQFIQDQQWKKKQKKIYDDIKRREKQRIKEEKKIQKKMEKELRQWRKKHPLIKETVTQTQEVNQ